MENRWNHDLRQVAVRMVDLPPLVSEDPLSNPQAVIKLLADTFHEYDREVVAIVNLKSNLQPISMNIVSMGALDQSVVHPREVMKTAILSNAASILMVHNHPSGKTEPSKQDILITDRMNQVCELMGIPLLDHVIVGPRDSYYSFKEKEVMPISRIKLTDDLERIELGGLKVAETIEKPQSKEDMIKQAREKQAQELAEVIEQLEQGVQGVFNSEDYKRFLDVVAKLPKYSVNNLLLIAMQTEGKASMCQSFTGWKAMGRFVKKGEKGIKILAPSPYTIQREQNKIDKATGQPVFDQDGEPVKEQVDITMNAFKVVRTFDISQTDGKEIPSLGVNELVGSIEGYGTLMEALKKVCPVPISFEDIDSGAKGFYHQIEKRIAIQDGMSEVQTVKTAIHEMAHQKLHAKDDINILDATQSRNSKEVEAESVAYAVCQHYGINTSDYSFGYVAGWSEGKELPELKKSLDTIRVAAAEMITSIDTELEHVRETISLGADAFAKIYMEDQDRGNLMIGEYASSLSIDSNLNKDAVLEIQDKIETFLKTEVHSEDEIKELGKELLTAGKRDDGEFYFNGENLLGEKGATASTVDNHQFKEEEPEEKNSKRKPSVRKKVQQTKGKVVKQPVKKTKVKEEACV